MRNIKLLDGTIYQVDRCGAADGRLRLRLINLPGDINAAMISVITAFGDPAKTAVIEHYFDETINDHQVYEHYTALEAVMTDGPGLVVIMREVPVND